MPAPSGTCPHSRSQTFRRRSSGGSSCNYCDSARQEGSESRRQDDREKTEAKPAAENQRRKPTSEKTAPPSGVLEVTLPKKGAWNQWGGSGLRNNTPDSTAVFTGFHPGGFDRKTGAWKKDKAKFIKWVSSLGSQSYGNPVVAGGKVVARHEQPVWLPEALSR
jgi:hypothetical protein